MSIEDRVEERVRAATRARAGLVGQVRPLELPDELPARGRRGDVPGPPAAHGDRRRPGCCGVYRATRGRRRRARGGGVVP